MSIGKTECPDKNEISCDELGCYISGSYRHSQILINKAFEKFSIGHGLYVFMLFIYFNEGTSQIKPSRELGLDKTTTAKALKRLEADDFLLLKEFSDAEQP